MFIYIHAILGGIMNENKVLKAKELFLNNGSILKNSELKQTKFHSREVVELINRGYISKISRGIFVWKENENSLSDNALACGLIPQGTIYLYSAAVYYELTTFNPMSVSLAVPLGSREIKLPSYLPIDLYPIHSNYELGREQINNNGEIIRIYNIERTVCDFFKQRNKIGKDITLEVLKNYMTRKDKNIQKLMEYSTILTDKKALSAYVEVLI